MKHTWIATLVFSSIALLASPAAALNLLVNPGFEEPGLNGWNASNAELIAGLPPMLLDEAVHSGAQSAGILEQGSLTQTVALSDAPTHTFGVWYRVLATGLSGNFDQIQASLKINVNNDTETIGTDPNNLGAGNFTAFSFLGTDFFLSDWIYMEGAINTLGLAGETALLNLNLQNFGSAITAVAFDDAFVAGQPVPEPGTVLLLGAGILGLGVYGRRKEKLAA